jgi:ABC-type transport system involved in cytochrome bd biosynthesis fused ATPase/permease subunit
MQFNAILDKNAVNIEMASFNWERESITPTLKALNLEVPRGQLVCVVGEVGSGKSSFLSALLNEMEKLQGFVDIHGHISYIPQQPWIQNLSFRDNILFGKPWDEAFYRQVVNACALEQDFEFLPDGGLL